ncbi:hypothetical protein B0H67DRAFT_645203 [Lasiosphaeris hirsuta]|uniref:Peptidase A1 domain-containing protein n=1 Tax=Lasiosphaeris hirsuta TaxID=260670 RepID=A0AA40AGL0_9PEZI|nr:hypothetical protein B0H67DRAFT_645203 [Lasiosphaeris hirsuta]
MGQAYAAPICQAPPTIQLSLGACTILSNLSDVHSWGVRFGVEGSNEICAVPSTVVNSTFLTSSEICDDSELGMEGEGRMTVEQCRSRRGGYIYQDKLIGVSTAGLAQLNQGWGALDNPITLAARATLDLGRHSIASIVVLFNKGYMSTSSHIGLAAASTLLQDLKSAGLIGSRSWGLNSGSQSVEFPRDGSLVLGGYDEASLGGSFFDYNIAVPDKLENRDCPLQAVVTGLTISVKNGNMSQPTSKVLVDNANKMAACIEPYDNQFRMPGPLLDQFLGFFQQVTKFSGDPVLPPVYNDHLLNAEPGIVYPKSAGQFNATLRFTLNYNLTVEIPFYELQRPLRGLDKEGKVVVDSNYTELQIFRTPAEGDAPVLGKAFLSQLYLYVNYETMKFHLASQNIEASTPLPVPAEDCVPTSTGRTPETNGLIAVGSVLGALIVALLAFCLYKVLKARRPPPSYTLSREAADVSLPPPLPPLPPTMLKSGPGDQLVPQQQSTQQLQQDQSLTEQQSYKNNDNPSPTTIGGHTLFDNLKAGESGGGSAWHES